MNKQLRLLILGNFTCYLNSFLLGLRNYRHASVPFSSNGPQTIMRYNMLIFTHFKLLYSIE